MSISFLRKLFGDSDPVQPVDAKADSSENAKSKSQSAANDVADFEADDDQVSSKGGKDIAVPLSALEQFVLYVVKNLVDNPDEVTYETVEKNRMNVIRIRCAKNDIGKIIGKSGKTISALRLLVQNAAGRNGHRVTVDVLD